MNDLTLVLLVDAFRRDYAERTRFIRRLAGVSRTGALREDFGFLPRAGYFGGLTPSEHGFTNMFCCDPERSPFGMARGLPASRHGRAVEDRLGIRGAVEASARARVTPYAADYLWTAEIPLDLLPWFALAEERAPWDSRVGYRSIFHELDERAEPYVYCAWPETNRLSDRTDAGIVSHALDTIQPPCRYAFVHLQDLDAAGHIHGPESAGLREVLVEADAQVERLVEGLRSRFDRVNIILFGDHGMVSVTGAADVWAAVAATGLVPGRDVVFFLDSTMARFWFPGGAGRSRVRAALAGLPGRVLDADDLARFDMAGCDPRNAELIFLANPGVLIVPNFFQRDRQLVAGMHGYDPDCPDNQGFFLVHEAAVPVAGSVGVVRPQAIHAESRRLTGLAADAPAAAGVASGAARLRGTLTQHPHADAHALLASHMQRMVREVRSRVPDAEAIVLCGSFGRDEGGVVPDQTRGYAPVNDYDVLVVTPPAGQHVTTLGALGDELAQEFGTDFVHFAAWTSLDPLRKPTQANVDIRHGSRVLWGPADVLDRLPPLAAADIPIDDGVQLVLNRLGGMLTALRLPPLAVDAAGRRYLWSQTMKALMAVGDYQLIRTKAYDVSYAVRYERLSWLAHGFGWTDRQRDLVLLGYEFKLHPEAVLMRDVEPLAEDVARWLVDTAIDGIGRITGRRLETAVEAAAAYYDLTTHDASGDPRGSARQTIYAALLLLGSAAGGDDDAFAEAGARLDACLAPPWPVELSGRNWEESRQRLSEAWLSMVH